MDNAKDPKVTTVTITTHVVTETGGEAPIVNVTIGNPDNSTPQLLEAPPKYSENPPEFEEVSPEYDLFALYRVRLSLQIS